MRYCEYLCKTLLYSQYILIRFKKKIFLICTKIYMFLHCRCVYIFIYNIHTNYSICCQKNISDMSYFSTTNYNSVKIVRNMKNYYNINKDRHGDRSGFCLIYPYSNFLGEWKIILNPSSSPIGVRQICGKLIRPYYFTSLLYL